MVDEISNSFAIALVGDLRWLSVTVVTTVRHVTIYGHQKLSPQKGTKGTERSKNKIN
jgi:hypothetical protein